MPSLQQPISRRRLRIITYFLLLALSFAWVFMQFRNVSILHSVVRLPTPPSTRELPLKTIEQIRSFSFPNGSLFEWTPMRISSRLLYRQIAALSSAILQLVEPALTDLNDPQSPNTESSWSVYMRFSHTRVAATVLLQLGGEFIDSDPIPLHVARPWGPWRLSVMQPSVVVVNFLASQCCLPA